MGQFDSSRTRVTPVFNQLLARDPSGVSWLTQLLRLPSSVGRLPVALVSTTQPLTASGWGTAEKGLHPPRALLKWIVQHGHLLQPLGAKTSAATQAKRQAICNRDPRTIAGALIYLAQPQIPRHAWYIFEGTTRPDVYLETSEVLREMPVRIQSLCHLIGRLLLKQQLRR